MKTIEVIALTILGIVLVIAVLQRADATGRVLSGLGGFTTDTIGALTNAPR